MTARIRMLHPLLPAFLAAWTVGGCVFDPSGIAPPTGPLFAGCWQGGDWGGIRMVLVHHDPDQLYGELSIDTSVVREDYGVAGRATTDFDAYLHGNSYLHSDVPIFLLRAPNDTLTLRLGESPPSAPLARCP